MTDDRLAHDVARATSLHIVELVGHLLRDEEKGDLFREVSARVEAGIAAYLAFKAQDTRRILGADPGVN